MTRPSLATPATPATPADDAPPRPVPRPAARRPGVGPQITIGRRRALTLVGGVALATVAGCANGTDRASSAAPTTTDGSGSPSSTTTTTTTTTGNARPNGPGGPGAAGGGPGGAPPQQTPVEAGTIPEETAGPYPGDGSNGPNVLDQDGVVRRNLTTSFGDAKGRAEGVPLTVTLTVVDLSENARKLEGAAVYAWHCNRDGNYSLYSGTAQDENYLRGVQVADENGVVTFETIFPAAYSGRWPHIHFEVYPDLATAKASGTKLRTSQLALPAAACKDVYAHADGYERSATNLEQTPLAQDNVFSDGWSLQTPTMTGSVAKGFVATLVVPV